MRSLFSDPDVWLPIRLRLGQRWRRNAILVSLLMGGLTVPFFFLVWFTDEASGYKVVALTFGGIFLFFAPVLSLVQLGEHEAKGRTIEGL